MRFAISIMALMLFEVIHKQIISKIMAAPATTKEAIAEKLFGNKPTEN